MQQGDMMLISDPHLGSEHSKFNGSMLLVWFSFTLIIIGTFLSGIVSLTQPPDQADYSSDGYQEVYEDYQDRIFTLGGLATLLINIGVVTLGAGLVSLSVLSSDRFDQWVKVALMAGTMLYLVRLFTSDLSISDTLALIQMQNW
jgi:hypothetical protein